MTCVQEVGKEETDEVEEVGDKHVGTEEDYGACREILDDHVSTPGGAPRVLRVVHSARYRTRCAIADTFAMGNVVLVGDAAHRHGPAGGQGV